MGCIMDNYSISIHTPVNECHHICLSLVQSACSVPPLLYFIISTLLLPLSGTYNDYDEYNPRNKATGYLELCSPIINHNTSFEIEF